MRSVLKRPDFRRLFAGLFFSMTAESILLLALAIWVKDITKSNGMAGAALFAVIAPMVFAPVIGFVVDRFRRKPFLVTVLALSAVLLSALFFVHGRDQVWIIYAVGVGYGVSIISVNAALNGLIKVVVPEEQLAEANGALQTVKQGLRLIAPLLGAGLYVSTKGWGLAVVAMVGFVVAAVVIGSMRVNEPAPQPTASRWAAEVAAGVRHVFHTDALRHVVIGVVATTSVFGFSESVGFAIVDQGLHRPPAFIAVMVSAQGIGGLIGGLTAAKVVRWFGEIGTVAVGVMLLLPLLVTSIWPTAWLVLTTATICGLGLPLLIVGFNTLMQRVTPSELMGRVSAALDALVSGPQAISIAVGAILVEQVPFRALLVVMAVVSAGSALYMWTKRGLSQAAQPMHDQPVGDAAAVGQPEVIG